MAVRVRRPATQPAGNHTVQRRPHPTQTADDARTDPLTGEGSKAERGERIEHFVNIDTTDRRVKKFFSFGNTSQENRQPVAALPHRAGDSSTLLFYRPREADKLQQVRDRAAAGTARTTVGL